MHVFDAKLCYCFSDEANFLFTKKPCFSRIEKIDSVFAGLFSVAFSWAIEKRFKKKKACVFDCRVIPLPKEKVIDYLIWRQAECLRNHNNSYAQYVLEKSGIKPREVAKRLCGLKKQELFELVKRHGINLNKTPVWHRNGFLLYKQKYKKQGYNPITKKKVIVERRKIVIDWEIPNFWSKEGKKFVGKILEDGI